MANRARSTIMGINILGNSVRGLNFVNWWKVYNALIIPILTYRVQVWYTGIKQKGLIHHLQVTQNDRIRKIMEVFKTTPTKPLYNLTGIPPIAYLLPKLIHAYVLRLTRIDPHATVRSVLTHDRCHYWPNYITPCTNLSHISALISPSTYRPINLCTARIWSPPYLTYLPNPPATL